MAKANYRRSHDVAYCARCGERLLPEELDSDLCDVCEFDAANHDASGWGEYPGADLSEFLPR